MFVISLANPHILHTWVVTTVQAFCLPFAPKQLGREK